MEGTEIRLQLHHKGKRLRANQFADPHSSTLVALGKPSLGGKENCVSTKTFPTPACRLSKAWYSLTISSNGTRCVTILFVSNEGIAKSSDLEDPHFQVEFTRH